MVIVYITLLSRDSSFIHTYKLIPLYSYREVVKGSFEAFRTVFLNVGLFIPFGYFLFSAGRRKSRSIIISFIFSVGIELLQYLTGRGLCEVDDVISNTIGAIIGILISALLKDRFSSLMCILFLAGGLIAGTITIIEPKDTIYEKQFFFDVFSASSNENNLFLNGTCHPYDSQNHSFTIWLNDIEDGTIFQTETKSNQSTFTATAIIKPKHQYECMVSFDGYPALHTSVFVCDEIVSYVEGKVNPPIIPKLESVLSDGVLKVYNAEYDTYLYQCGNRFYWIIGYSLDETNTLICHLHTDEPELLSPDRRQYKFDNIDIRIGRGCELHDLGTERYRVFYRDIPQGYSITYVAVGISEKDQMLWYDRFRLARENYYDGG